MNFKINNYILLIFNFDSEFTNEVCLKSILKKNKNKNFVKILLISVFIIESNINLKKLALKEFSENNE